MQRWRIVTKILAAVCGVVAVLALLGGAFFVRLDIQKERKIVANFQRQIDQSIADRERQADESLKQNAAFNTMILSQSGAGDLYNVRADDLQNILRSHLQYPEIIAIRVTNEFDEPFAAGWKTDEIAVAERLPADLPLNRELSVQSDSLYENQRVGKFEVFYTDTVIHQEIQQKRDAAAVAMQEFSAASQARLKNSLLTQGAGVAVILLALIFCVRMVIRSVILKPLSEVSEITERLAAFDLTVKVATHQADEIGRLFTAIDNMVASFRQIVGQVQQSGMQVASSSMELTATAKEQEATVIIQSNSTQEVLQTITEITNELNDLVQIMQKVSARSEKTAEFATSGQSDLAHIGETMRRMEHASTAISARLQDIHAKTASITSVVTMITKVAEQTNLLSLNASIEAEKAGEYGRGFIVVAREIRRLADQTAVATLTIEQTVKTMQSAVSTGVMEMDKFMAEVRYSVEDVGHIRLQLNRIIEQVQTLSPDFEHVKQVMTHQSENANQINEAMLMLGEGMQQTKTSLHETYSAIQQLNDAAHSLHDEVSRFKVGSSRDY